MFFNPLRNNNVITEKMTKNGANNTKRKLDKMTYYPSAF